MTKKPGQRASGADASKNVRNEGNYTFLQAIGQRIRQARLDAGLTGEQLSVMAACSVSWLYSLEAGNHNFTIDSLLRVVEALGLELRVVLVSKDDVRVRVATDRLAEITSRSQVTIASITDMAAELRLLNAETLEVLHSAKGSPEIS